MNEDLYEKSIEASFNAAALHEILEWIIRAFISIIVVTAFALIIKYTLISPYSMSIIEFEIKAGEILGKDI